MAGAASTKTVPCKDKKAGRGWGASSGRKGDSWAGP